jgi:hypothetical protein
VIDFFVLALREAPTCARRRRLGNGGRVKSTGRFESWGLESADSIHVGYGRLETVPAAGRGRHGKSILRVRAQHSAIYSAILSPLYKSTEHAKVGVRSLALGLLVNLAHSAEQLPLSH